jgi:hypothetical protein
MAGLNDEERMRMAEALAEVFSESPIDKQRLKAVMPVLPMNEVLVITKLAQKILRKKTGQSPARRIHVIWRQ